MKFRCPYCRHVFGPDPLPVCPRCRRGIRTPARLTAGYEERRRRIRKRRREEESGRRPGIEPLSRRLLSGKAAMLGAMLAVLSIVSVMLVTAARGRKPAADTTRMGKARKEVDVLNTALDLFHSDCGRFPSQTEGLVALVRDPGVSNWGGPYVNLVKPDPWQTRYIYQTDGANARASSAGPDRTPGTDDDVRPPAAKKEQVLSGL